jgi:hypothetical protein
MHPLLLTYISTSLFTLYLPLLKLLEVCRGRRRRRRRSSSSSTADSHHTW